MLEFSDVAPKLGVVFVKYQQYLSDSGECVGVVITADHSLDSSFIVKLVKAAKEGELMVVDVVSENAEHRVSHIQKYCDFEVIVPTDCKLDANEVARRYFDSFNDVGITAIDVNDVCNLIRAGSSNGYAFYGCGNTAAMAVQDLTQNSSFLEKLTSTKSVLLDIVMSEPTMVDAGEIATAIENLAPNDCVIVFTARWGIEIDGLSVLAIIS